MRYVPKIQDLSPAYVLKVLISQPCGTYIIRKRVLNDDLISSIKINNQPTTLSGHDYVVLSVRVPHKKHPSEVMNYRLRFTGENLEQLLEQYYSQAKKSKEYTSLEREFIVSGENPNWIVNPKQFDEIFFEKGRFGGKHHDAASKAIWQRSRQDTSTIFIKRYSKTSSSYDNELNLLKELCFFPIIAFYGYYSDQEYNYLVFPYAGRSLKSICPLPDDLHDTKMHRIVRIAFQIANAMIYLEKKNIVHRDLTASNVLLDDYGFIHIADFGHAIQKIEGTNNLSPLLTNNGQNKFQLRFLAPECMIKSSQSQTKYYGNFSSKSDVWAFGILLIELMLDKTSKPYPDIKDDDDIPQHIVTNRKMHPRPDGCNFDIYLILQQCWAYEPINRISFTEIREKMHMLVSIFS